MADAPDADAPAEAELDDLVVRDYQQELLEKAIRQNVRATLRGLSSRDVLGAGPCLPLRIPPRARAASSSQARMLRYQQCFPLVSKFGAF